MVSLWCECGLKRHLIYAAQTTPPHYSDFIFRLQVLNGRICVRTVANLRNFSYVTAFHDGFVEAFAVA